MKGIFKKKAKSILTSVLSVMMFCSLGLGFGALKQTTVEAENKGDTEYYVPVGVASAGWAWSSTLQVADNADGSVHVSFNKTTYVTIRTTSEKSYQLDGLHLKFANFEGDGMGIAFSNYAAPDSYDPAIRLFPCNVQDSGKAYMRASFPDWGGLRVLSALETYPMSANFEISVHKAESGWDFVFDGQTFHFTDEQVDEAIPDKDNVYISFAGMGGSSYVNTFSFDYLSAHGGDDRCADTLTAQEQQAIQNVYDKIANIGKVSTSQASQVRIQLATQAYQTLSDELKPMIKTYNELVYAQQNYYALTNALTFDENNIISDFYIATDNHLDTNDCTTFADGSPQDRFEIMLDMVDSANPDALILTGDMTDWVRFDDSAGFAKAYKQLNMLKDSLDNHWSGDSALFFTMGNHDSSESPGESRVEMFYEVLTDKYYASDINKSEAEWAKGYRHAKIAGFDYLTVEWNYAGEAQNISDEAIAWLKAKLEQITSAPDYDGKPIFFVSHVAFNNTVDGSNAGAETLTKQKLYAVLENYPQIVMLTGHSHHSLAHEKFIFQSAITTLQAGTTAYIGMPGPDHLDDGGYHLGSSSYRPKDMLQNLGLYLEIDKDYNIRVTRIDFTKDGQQIYTQVIIPAPDLVNKTHLNYYTEARASRVEAPAFKANATVEAKSISATELEITFDTTVSEGLVQDYHILIENGTESYFCKSFQAAWRYINDESVPEKKTVHLENFTLAKPYTITVRACDSFGNLSEPLTCTVSDSVEVDQARADAVDALIAQIGVINEENTKIEAAMEAYNKLSYDQKERVATADLLFTYYAQYEALFKTLEEYEYGVCEEKTVFGQNYWLNGMMDFHDDEKGIVIKYIDGVPNVRMGIKRFNLDGLHLTFDSLKKEDNMVADPSIGIILGGTIHPQYTEPEKTGILMFFDTNIGKIEMHPGGQIVCRGDELKYRNLKDKQFDIRFTALEDGGFKVECAGLVGKIDASYFDGSFSLKDTAKTYVSLSNWVDGAYFSYRLLAAHDGSKPCVGYGKVPVSKFQTMKDTIQAIDEIGNVSLQSGEAIEKAESLYASLPECLHSYVTNYEKLQSARTLYNKLLDLQKPDDSSSSDSQNSVPETPGNSGDDGNANKGGCNSMIGAGGLPMLAIGFAIITKKRKGERL